MRLHLTIALLFLSALIPAAFAGNESTPIGEPVLEPPTLRCLGVYWLIRGDDNQNARVEFDYRKSGTSDWLHGAPLFRVERRDRPYLDEGEKIKPPSKVQVPSDGWLFAGSLLLLDPDTTYDLKLKLIDPDGGDTERMLSGRTIAEPFAVAAAPIRHVKPGDGGGSGTETDPYKGIAAAESAARPGDIMLLHAGAYNGPIELRRSGEPGNPIVWRGAGDGEAVIDGKCPLDKPSGAAVTARGLHDVWFENLTICNAYYCLGANESQRIVVRRCHFHHAICGVVATHNKSEKLSNFFICDNLFEGEMPWPVTHQQWEELPESRAVWLTGSGHVVCYNRIHHWKDGMDTDDSAICCAIDFHNNDISEMFDDGSEMDGSERNTRNFLNRYCNTLTGVSLQPVYGGPIYVFRNVIFNCATEAFKLHNSPSGGVLIHNTVVKSGQPLQLQTSAEVFHCIARNNLVLGTSGRAIDYSPKLTHCDFDYDGFGGFNAPVFIKWDRTAYHDLEDVRRHSPAEKHCTIVDPATAFASGLTPPADAKLVFDFSKVDVRLRPGCAAIDAGEVLPGFNDGFRGKAPDLGAYEFGAEIPHYGPRPLLKVASHP